MTRRIGPAIPDELLAGGDAAVALNSGDIVNALKKARAERSIFQPPISRHPTKAGQPPWPKREA